MPAVLEKPSYRVTLPKHSVLTSASVLAEDIELSDQVCSFFFFLL